ncbi:DUF2971 domain-containing protein [Agathobaculum sp. Marseille-P7918]|uniref:DUF2971 domain-containing protein n=1 Tax=Agathobaculum sp. Marseille-P7918 TaxID=2479843 RepID=UPI0013DE76AC|nr:DUF2971 domain-containing protein [Agathobaculum sp. Marseille-P7918]
MPDTGSGIVYHYCSLEAFKSIIENECLWLCDVEKSNDSGERVYFNHIMAQTIENLSAQMKNQNKYDEAHQQGLEHLRCTLAVPQEELAPFYSCSFSRNGDLLSQWRGYGDDGYGVSIGVCESLFQINLPADCFCAVEYSKAMAEAKCREILDQTTRDYLKDAERSEWDAVSSFTLCALSSINQQSIFYKSSAFKEEDEYRIITSDTEVFNIFDMPNGTLGFPGPEIINSAKNAFSLSEKKFRIAKHRLSAYYELSFKKVKNDFIEYIILGPKCMNSETDIKRFLESCGYNSDYIEIRPSEATYR